MATTRRYTTEELIHLRESPLVKKPDNLPAIEQWIEYVYLDIDGTREKLRIPHSETQQNQRHQNAQSGRQQRTAVAAEASPMGNFSTGQRPGLLHSRSTRNGEEITLGPPKTLFASSKNISKLAELEKPSTPLTEAALQEGTEGKGNDRFSRDHFVNRKSMGTEATDGKAGRSDWRTPGPEEERSDGAERNSRYARREREQDGERRNGIGGDRTDSRWQRDDRRTNGEPQQGGWRQRERERREREGWRGQDGGKEPEWMDEPASKQEEDASAAMGMPKTVEDFEQWKKNMKARDRQSTELVEDAVVEPPAPPPTQKETTAIKPLVPMKLDGFGSWDVKSAVPPTDGTPSASRTAPAKTAKKSKFMSLMQKDEPPQVPAELPSNQPSASAVPSRDAAEDKAGFDRVLQMLGSTTLSQATTPMEPSSPPPRQVSNGTKPKSRFTGFFDQTPKSPERMQSPEANTFGAPPPFQNVSSALPPNGRVVTDEPMSILGPRPAERQLHEQPPRNHLPTNPISPDQGMPTNIPREEQRAPSNHMGPLFLEQPPSRGASTPDINIQNLLASKSNARQQGNGENEKAFLLGLLQNKGSKPAVPQIQPDDNFQLWRQQPPQIPQSQPHAPKPRVQHPPGLFEDQLLRNHPTQDLPRQIQQPAPLSAENEAALRRFNQRAAPPPGFVDDLNSSGFSQQPNHHQRNFTEPPRHFQGQHQPPPPQQQTANQARRMSGHPNFALPPMQIPSQPQQPPYPPEFLQSPSANIGAAGPPPGFNPHGPRHPPGIHNIPNIFSAPQPPPQHAHQPPPQQQSRDQQQGAFGGLVSPGAASLDPRFQPQGAPVLPPGFYGRPPGFGMPPPGHGFVQGR